MERSMSTNDYVPPKVWTHLKSNGGVFKSINRPTAGATFERDLPKGNMRRNCTARALGTA
jgi:hypothetical protein